MKILVTGGAGFIGSNFVRHILTSHGDDSVVNLDKLTYAGNLENLRDVEKDPRYRFVRGDVCDGAIVREAMEGVDAVVHFAAETHVDRSNAAADEFLRTNVNGTFTLLETARALGIQRFIAIGTDEVYGSIAKGAALAKTGGGGKTIQCAICHGDALTGLGEVPRIAGLQPVYIARQLITMQNGTSAGENAALMKKVVAKLSEDEIIALSAYLGSLPPR